MIWSMMWNVYIARTCVSLHICAYVCSYIHPSSFKSCSVFLHLNFQSLLSNSNNSVTGAFRTWLLEATVGAFRRWIRIAMELNNLSNGWDRQNIGPSLQILKVYLWGLVYPTFVPFYPWGFVYCNRKNTLCQCEIDLDIGLSWSNAHGMICQGALKPPTTSSISGCFEHVKAQARIAKHPTLSQKNKLCPLWAKLTAGCVGLRYVQLLKPQQPVFGVFGIELPWSQKVWITGKPKNSI